MDCVTFTKQSDGTFKQEGELPAGTKHGIFQWFDTQWRGFTTVEPLTDLFERMTRSGLYKYPAYRIIPAEKKELVIKPTCYGCGMIAGIDCGVNPLGVGRDFTGRGASDPLVDFNEDHQFSISLPVTVKGKNFGKSKSKTVWFNSVRCANLALLELTRTERNGVVKYNYDTPMLGEYRAAQGWKRCPACKRLLNDGRQFCDTVCESKYDGDIRTVLNVAGALGTRAVTLREATPRLEAKNYPCAHRNCIQGEGRKRARVTERGAYCSGKCSRQVKQVARNKARNTLRTQPSMSFENFASGTLVNTGDFASSSTTA